MNGHLLQDRVEIFQFETIRGILAILLGDVTGRAWQTGGFMLGAFQDDLLSVTF